MELVYCIVLRHACVDKIDGGICVPREATHISYALQAGETKLK